MLVTKLHGLGAKNVVLTGVECGEKGEIGGTGDSGGGLGSAVSNGKDVVYDFNPKLERMSHGTGDVFASVFAGAVVRGKTAAEAAALAADIVCEAIANTSPEHWYGVSFETAIPKLVDELREVKK